MSDRPSAGDRGRGRCAPGAIALIAGLTLASGGCLRYQLEKDSVRATNVVVPGNGVGGAGAVAVAGVAASDE